MEINKDMKILFRNLLCDIDENIGMMIENQDEGHRLELGIEAAKKIEEISSKLGLGKVYHESYRKEGLK